MFGERFRVTYKICGSEKSALEKANDICIEQTVEFPAELVTQPVIRDHVFGKVEDFSQSGKNIYLAVISFDAAITGMELPQFLNVIFGNISIKKKIRVENIHLSEKLLKKFKGPRFGKNGIRKLHGINDRPILCTALKPMGLSNRQLSDLAYKFALGGIDIIKDDHGIADQSFSRFEERVRLCAQAVRRANSESGQNALYVSNITSYQDQIIERAKFARDFGASGLLIAPGLAGWDVMRKISEDSSIDLPLFAHPAMLGTYVINPFSGISHRVLFGQIFRICGADAAIFPNFGTRFSFSRNECRQIIEGVSEDMGSIKEIFPCPGGGMKLNQVPELMDFYGSDVIFLIGGDLFRQGPDLIETCRHFRSVTASIAGKITNPQYS
jgi:ribulose-bisphosphate carboxylase large chain